MQLVPKIQTVLETVYPEGEALAITRWLLEERLHESWTMIRLMSEEHLEPAIRQQLKLDTDDLLKGKPVQYILGETQFSGLSFTVNEHVLIPRPETEELVQWILNERTDTRSKTWMDVGTGSGCIAVTLKKQRPNHHVVALDISEQALTTAKRNAQRNGVTVEFRSCNFLDESSWPEFPQIDLLVSNPPYISLAEKDAMDKNVTEWEPHIALFVPREDPLLFYRKIRDFALRMMPLEAAVYLEINQQLSEATGALFGDGFYGVEIRNDLNGNPRMLKAIRSR